MWRSCECHSLIVKSMGVLPTGQLGFPLAHERSLSEELYLAVHCVTGDDLQYADSQEERAKRETRAARFATSGAAGQEYTPIVDEEDAKRRERAARFGTEFNAVDHSGLKEQGAFEVDQQEQ